MMKGNNLKTLSKHERGFPISLLRYEGHDSPNDHTDYNLSEANYLGSFHSPARKGVREKKTSKERTNSRISTGELMRLNAKTRPRRQEQRNPIGGPQLRVSHSDTRAQQTRPPAPSCAQTPPQTPSCH